MKKLIALISMLLFSASLAAAEINQFVMLGDSLSDNGNLYQKIRILPKSPPYFQGRFTNGPTWAEILGDYLYEKYAIDTENYAVGGATSVLHNPIYDKFAPPITLTGEVYDYLFHSLFTDRSDVLFGIWIGANDYLYNTKTSDMDTTSTRVVDNIQWTIETLASYGGKTFFVMNMPDLARTPHAIDNGLTKELHSVTVMHNKKLEEAIKNIRALHPDIKIIYVNIYEVFYELLDHPNKINKKYNKHFTDFTRTCWEGGMTLKTIQETNLQTDLNKAYKQSKLPKHLNTQLIAKTIASSPSLTEAYLTGQLAENGGLPCTQPNQYVFWDHIHPTEAVHEVIASIVQEYLAEENI